jgi:hypothetical protein
MEIKKIKMIFIEKFSLKINKMKLKKILLRKKKKKKKMKISF